MTLKLSDLALSPEATNEILTGVTQGSAFQAASRPISLSGEGSSFWSTTRGAAEWTGETEAKPNNQPVVAKRTITPYKLANTFLVSEEIYNDKPQLVNTVMLDGVVALTDAFDQTVAGHITAPGANFHTFASVTDAAAPITSYAAFEAAIAEVASQKVRDVSIVLSTAFLGGLKSVVNDFGVASLTFTGNYDRGTINGYPYYAYASNVAEAFVGPFGTGARYGIVPGSVALRASRDATIVNGDGTVTSAFQTNQVAIVIEGRFGFQVDKASQFRGLALTA